MLETLLIGRRPENSETERVLKLLNIDKNKLEDKLEFGFEFNNLLVLKINLSGKEKENSNVAGYLRSNRHYIADFDDIYGENYSWFVFQKIDGVET